MKLFLKKVILFLVFITLIIVILDFYSYLFLKDNILRYSLTLKVNNQPNLKDNQIFIAGDSRADRHVIPLLIEQKTNCKAVNLAVAGCNIVSIKNMFEKYNMTENNVIVIGISSPNYFDNDFKDKSSEFELAHIANLNIINRIKYSGSNYFRDLGLIYSEFLREKILGEVKNESYSKQKGYFPVNGNIDINEYKRNFEKHPWYICPNFDGFRSKTFKKSIKEISEWNSSIVFYNPNVAPTWYKYVSEEIDSLERRYSNKLDSLCNQYDNIYFLDFYTNKIANITDQDFYNMQHMNDSGANKFTSVLIDSLYSLGLVNCVRKQE